MNLLDYCVTRLSLYVTDRNIAGGRQASHDGIAVALDISNLDVGALELLCIYRL